MSKSRKRKPKYPESTRPDGLRNIPCSLYIYWNKITNNTYVGVTIDLDRRHKDHLRDAFKKNKQSPLCCAFRKYGVENIERVVVCTYDNEWDAADAEGYCTNSGLIGEYNQKPGGGSRAKLTDEIREKIAKGNKGKKRTPEQIDNHRQSLLNSPAMKAAWEAQVGASRTPETVESITIAQRARREFSKRKRNIY
jgi:group I intron endonuclease